MGKWKDLAKKKSNIWYSREEIEKIFGETPFHQYYKQTLIEMPSGKKAVLSPLAMTMHTYGYKCHYCGRECDSAFEARHFGSSKKFVKDSENRVVLHFVQKENLIRFNRANLIPLIDGGSHILANSVILCNSCMYSGKTLPGYEGEKTEIYRFCDILSSEIEHPSEMIEWLTETNIKLNTENPFFSGYIQRDQVESLIKEFENIFNVKKDISIFNKFYVPTFREGIYDLSEKSA